MDGIFRILVLTVFGMAIPFLIFGFAAFWLHQGLPIFFDLWHEQATTRPLLTGVVILLVVGILGGSLAGSYLWVQFVRKAGLVNGLDVWPFRRNRHSQMRVPAEVQKVEMFQSSRRWAIRLALIWLSFWALLGGAAAAASIIPFGLWVLGGIALLQSVWRTFSSTDVPFVIVIICMFLGVFTVGPVAFFKWMGKEDEKG